MRPAFRPASRPDLAPSRPFVGGQSASPNLGTVGTMMHDLKVGAVVLHERFGRGVVQALEGSGIDAKATVCFENAGTKVLMLRFAKLTLQ